VGEALDPRISFYQRKVFSMSRGRTPFVLAPGDYALSLEPLDDEAAGSVVMENGKIRARHPGWYLVKIDVVWAGDCPCRLQSFDSVFGDSILVGE